MKQFNTTKKWFLGILLIAGFVSCSNVSSSELRETSAEDLKLRVNIYENNDETLVDVGALMLTVPDDIGIQFNQGEIFEAGLLLGDEEIDSSSMNYDNNFLDFGENYSTRISKLEAENEYFITYTDAEGTATTATFSSEGVPALTAPAEEAEISLDSTVSITWNSANTGDMAVKIIFENDTGGISLVKRNIEDTGNYSLDLSDEVFNRMAVGDAIITLIHYTNYDVMDGFADADITVTSNFNRNVTIVAP